MNNEATSALIDCGWLAERLGSADLVVLDATFFLPAQNRSAAGEYLAGHIPGAVFFDIDAVADPDSPLPHMLPSPQQFAEAVGRLGIANTTQVVVYDANTFMASARVWWTFRVFGHDRVSVLDGGLVRWKALGHAVETEAAHRPPVRPFAAGFRPELVSDLAAMRAHQAAGDAQIIDARSPGRFSGAEPEPRPGLRAVHIPGSRNIFFKQLIDGDTGLMFQDAELRALFARSGLDLQQPVVATCGTGVTAAILALGLHCLGRPDVSVYDGSWTEWGAHGDTPVETGS
jgi:thiosulfate/3-mercaptopyruvate sulfurtransferase